MRVLRLVCLIGFLLCVASPLFIKLLASNGPTVQVSVAAMDPNRLALHYKWKSTDGTITNVDNPSTTWVLPPGPGIHFAYVLVFNNHGGYTERRVAVNTDTDGIPPVIPPPITWSAPAAPPQTGDYYRSYAPDTPSDVFWGNQNNFQIPTNANVLVYLQDTVSGKRFPATGGVTTDLKGQFIIPGLPPGTYTDHCSFDGGVSFETCTSWNWSDPAFFNYTTMPATAWTYYIPDPPPNLPPPVPQPTVGNLQLQDGNLCGTINNFFGVSSTGTASWLDSTGKTLATVPLNAQGVYALPYNAKGASIRLQCESAAPITITGITPNANGATIALQTLTGASDPIVTGMTAPLGTAQGLFLPPPSGLPSDAVRQADGFLAEKGLDTMLSACHYYLTIGAVKTCDASGNFTGAINFEDWKREVKIDKYATTTEYSATYINKADLNLTRNHHSVSYGPNETAAYVCNYQGYFVPNPFDQKTQSEINDFLAPAQSEVETAIANATFGTGAPGHDLVACVAMDWGITANVNNGAPFTRFLIFGPSGQLLPSVNLDGKREKFVPGTCVVCHGGDHYAGQFATDGTGPANIGAHFLTYDTGNFLFSKNAPWREVDQETAIYHLNQNVLNAGPTPSQKALISGWYGNGQVLNQNYVPTSWQGQGTAATNFYQIVVARSCRGCHQALAENYNWDDYASAMTAGLGGYLDGNVVCLGGGSLDGWRGHSMPNSLVTMNRFWLSSGSTVVPDQVAAFNQFAPNATCTPPPTPYQ